MMWTPNSSSERSGPSSTLCAFTAFDGFSIRSPSVRLLGQRREPRFILQRVEFDPIVKFVDSHAVCRGALEPGERFGTVADAHQCQRTVYEHVGIGGVARQPVQLIERARAIARLGVKACEADARVDVL